MAASPICLLQLQMWWADVPSVHGSGGLPGKRGRPDLSDPFDDLGLPIEGPIGWLESGYHAGCLPALQCWCGIGIGTA